MRKIKLAIDSDLINSKSGDVVESYSSVDELLEVFGKKIDPDYLVLLEGLNLKEGEVFVISICGEDHFPHFIWLTEREYCIIE